jgi:DNA polymerase epsilon subunit 1
VVEIESTLVDQLQRQVSSFCLQDLQCDKCRMVKAKNMPIVCDDCSGQFRCTQSTELLHRRIRVFQHLAEFHSFDWLKEVADWLQQQQH